MANIPDPIKRKEQYYAYMAGESTYLPEPITREEQYLYYLCVNGSGDPNTSSGKALYYAFNPGDTRRLMTAEDAENIITSATENATQAAENAAQNAQEYLKELKSYPKVTNHIIIFGE